MSQPDQAVDTQASWKSIYIVGGICALIVVLFGLLDIALTAVPGSLDASGSLTVVEWFTLLQDNWFIGVRNLGLLNVINQILMIPLFFALYGAHRRTNKVYAAFAAILMFVGAAIYVTNNVALPMLTLSDHYAAATTEAQKLLIEAAGQTMLAQAEDFTPGAFTGFFLPSVADLTMYIVLLRGGVFSKLAAWASILGIVLLLIFAIGATFVPGSFYVMMIFAGIGGLSNILGLVLIALRLFKLGRGHESTG